VAPFQAIPSNLRGVEVLYLHPPLEATPTDVSLSTWLPVPGESPIPAKQFVSVDATLAAHGNLTAKVHYSMRGDNELVLRVAFHQSPKKSGKTWRSFSLFPTASAGR